MKVERVPISSLSEDPANARRHPDSNLRAIRASFRRFGQQYPIVVGADDVVVVGSGRLRVARELGWDEIDIVRSDLEGAERVAFGVADNRTAELAEWDDEALAKILSALAPEQREASGFTAKDLELMLADDASKPEGGEPSTSLAERFLVPPFSVLDARAGYWQERKGRWLELGIRSELGRDGNLLGMSDTVLEKGASAPERERQGWAGYEGGDAYVGGTSVFDPVLCELAYRWFAPPAARVLDPFAGGSVRGIVAGHLGLSYMGVELREEQIASNRAQAAEILELKEHDPAVCWVHGDSAKMDAAGVPADGFDLVFSCPPYFDLERYSDDERDLSNAGTWSKFLKSYRAVIAAACNRLREHRFAVWVVSEIRDKDGRSRGFVPETIGAFHRAGLALYNECVLMQPIGSASIRAARIFTGGRKLTRVHQTVLVFSKGEPWAQECFRGEVEHGGLDEQDPGVEPLVLDGAEDPQEASPAA